jgi:hypothetical protein
MMPEIMQQLAALKTATINFDCLHEAQVLQLKNYPILIRGVSQPWEFSVDADRKMCTYKLKGKKLKNTTQEMAQISGYIKKYILWDQTTVQFFLNDILLFDSRNS